ncbi:MAG: 3-deoxy-7-phosphoheptulonate synthase, partial [Oscillospiraceae bacterium]
MAMIFRRKLPIPQEIKQMYPLSEEITAAKAERDKQIADVFTGKSDKFILIIGPCSADNEESVIDYVHRLAKIQERVKDKILI